MPGHRLLSLAPAPCCVCGSTCRCPAGMRVQPLNRRDDKAVLDADERRAVTRPGAAKIRRSA